MLALGEMCFEGMGVLKRGLDMLAPGEICWEGIETVAKGVSGVETS